MARAAGWSAFGLSVLSAIYTALKASPTGGGDNKKATEKPPLLQRFALAAGPFLLLLVLGIVMSWVGRHFYLLVLPTPDAPPMLWGISSLVEFVTRGALVAGFLFLVFALYELRPLTWWQRLGVVVVWFAVVGAASMIAPRNLKDYLT